MRIRKVTYGNRVVEYDVDTPCIICGEPVIGASMGGTVICGSCDCGKCRYCGMDIFVLREDIDGGDSKKKVLKHMEWHHKQTPEIVHKTNTATELLLDRLEERRLAREKYGSEKARQEAEGYECLICDKPIDHYGFCDNHSLIKSGLSSK